MKTQEFSSQLKGSKIEVHIKPVLYLFEMKLNPLSGILQNVKHTQ